MAGWQKKVNGVFPVFSREKPRIFSGENPVFGGRKPVEARKLYRFFWE
jgi:hypothetical protein